MARYEINHDCKIIEHDSALCKDLDNMLQRLFSQFGWNAKITDKQGSCRTIELNDANGNSESITVYCGAIRNELRNPYEKKIQLGNSSDPRTNKKESTVIIGVYVFEENDDLEDAIFVGYPIVDSKNYGANPSIRGTFVNQLLIKAKNDGFVYDEEHNTVGFRSEFAHYYLKNHYKLHYASNKYPEVSYDKEEMSLDSSTQQSDIDFYTQLKSDFSRNRILFGAPGTGKSFTINEDRKKLLGENNDDDYERVTFHPDYSYANFVGTYKPVMIDNTYEIISSATEKDVLTVLTDNSKSAQEKYDLLYEKFKDDELTRLPLLLSLYTDDDFKTRDADGSYVASDNSVECNQGKAIRPYVNLSKPSNGKKDISYEYVPGPFMRMYVKALRNSKTDNIKPYLLIIEEINRANVAAVFGDIFQLLDRGSNFVSEYPIQASEDIKKYLAKELGGNPNDYNKIRIPDNMFIWATMNSADQGVFTMDTAFKRRWDFTYLGIDDNDKDLRGKFVTVGSKEKQRFEWNELRKAINEFLAKEKINEDKQLGPYFISRNIVVPEGGGTEIDSKKFCDIFKNKVIMYLFDDAAKQKRSKLFEGSAKGQTRFSKICEAFDEQGVGIFNSDIQNAFKIQNPAVNRNTVDANDVSNSHSKE